MTELSSSQDNTAHTTSYNGVTVTATSTRGTAASATAVEYRIIVPTADNSATYVFIWSLA